MTYAYSLDGGETYRGSEPTPEDALGAAHDELSTEYEAGTTHSVHVARLVPGVEILRGKTIAATGAIKGQGLADDTVHQLTLEN